MKMKNTLAGVLALLSFNVLATDIILDADQYQHAFFTYQPSTNYGGPAGNCTSNSHVPFAVWGHHMFNPTPTAANGAVGGQQSFGRIQSCQTGWINFDLSGQADQTKTYELSYNWFQWSATKSGYKYLEVEVTYDGGLVDSFTHDQQATTEGGAYNKLGQSYTAITNLRLSYNKPSGWSSSDGYPTIDSLKLTEVATPPPPPPFDTYVSDATIEAGVSNFHASASVGSSIVMLDDKDANGIKEFITGGSISGSSSAALVPHEHGTKMFIVSTNADGSVKSYQPIGFEAVKDTGFDIADWSGYLREAKDYDGNGTTDVLLDNHKMLQVLLLDDDGLGGYKVIDVIKLSNAQGNLPSNIPGDVLFSSETEAYTDFDNNGTMDFLTSIHSSANKQFIYAREQLGYSGLAPHVVVNVLVLMHADGTVKDIKHFSDVTKIYKVSTDVDGDDIVDLMRSSTHGTYDIALMNSDFTVREIKSFPLTKNGDGFGQGLLGTMFVVNNADGNGNDGFAVAAYPHATGISTSSASLEFFMLNDNAGTYEVLNQKELVHADDYQHDQYNNMGGSLTGIVYATFSDMDGDGDLDLLIGNQGKGAIHIRFFD